MSYGKISIIFFEIDVTIYINRKYLDIENDLRGGDSMDDGIIMKGLIKGDKKEASPLFRLSLASLQASAVYLLIPVHHHKINTEDTADYYYQEASNKFVNSE